MTKLTCGCNLSGQARPCEHEATQEDLLCDGCREGKCQYRGYTDSELARVKEIMANSTVAVAPSGTEWEQMKATAQWRAFDVPF